MMSIAAGKHLLNDTFFFMMFLFFFAWQSSAFFHYPPQKNKNIGFRVKTRSKGLTELKSVTICIRVRCKVVQKCRGTKTDSTALS
jgi:hypothetical protein